MGHKNKLLTEKQYTILYLKMLDASYKTNREEWDKLLSMDSVTLVCYCPKGSFCHRHLLAKYLADKFTDRVELKGEI